mmetsp:Transcript_20529/g.69775  ORF Transcript_20529/g.69775 Transcript_20529/m.69775 type:complete len:207 (+) Transcript_20529:157-777(+)
MWCCSSCMRGLADVTKAMPPREGQNRWLFSWSKNHHLLLPTAWANQLLPAAQCQSVPVVFSKSGPPYPAMNCVSMYPLCAGVAKPGHTRSISRSTRVMSCTASLSDCVEFFVPLYCTRVSTGMKRYQFLRPWRMVLNASEKGITSRSFCLVPYVEFTTVGTLKCPSFSLRYPGSPHRSTAVVPLKRPLTMAGLRKLFVAALRRSNV